MIAPSTAPDYNTIWSGGWNDMRLHGPMSRHTRRLMRGLTQDLRPRSILDVGCGEGSLLKTLADAHPDVAVAGVEIAENALRLARRTLPSAEFKVMDIAAAHWERKFDLVVCADVIEHIADDETALQHMTAMTNSGGHIIVATLQGRMRRFETGIGHLRNYAPGELQAKITAAGLKVDRVIQWGFPFYSPLYRNFLEVLDNRGTMGRFGPARKLISQVLYSVFLLNSARRGDYIFVRARKEPQQGASS
jgi:SAM-dependent methyltransferase